MIVPFRVFSAGALVEVVGLRGALLAFVICNSAFAAVVALAPAGTHIAAPTDNGA